MQAFIEAGGKALQAARKAEKYAAGKTPEEQKKLARAGGLLKSSQAKLLAPIPWPRKNVVMSASILNMSMKGKGTFAGHQYPE
jgi:hypothetical protein